MAIEHGAVLAIVGAGFGGKGIAASLGIEGFRIRLHDVDEAKVAPIRAAGGIKLTKHSRKFVPVEIASTDLGAVLPGAAAILVSTYGNDHEQVAKMMAPLLTDGQIVLLVQGHFFGSWLFQKALKDAGCTAVVDVGEMDSYPYMVGIVAPDTVEMGTVKAKWRMAATPANRTSKIMEQVGWMFPGMVPARSLIDSAFSLGGLFHIAGIVTNVSRVENSESYHFYAANMTSSVCNLIDAMDRERMAIASGYGVRVDDVRTWLAQTYDLHHASLVDSLQEMARTHYEHAPAPKTLKHRYLVQDVGCDLVGALSLARLARIPTPVSEAVITLAGALTCRDFYEEGRNLRRLGLDGLSPQEIVARVSQD